jgi:hypothetical protein
VFAFRAIKIVYTDYGKRVSKKTVVCPKVSKNNRGYRYSIRAPMVGVMMEFDTTKCAS